MNTKDNEVIMNRTKDCKGTVRFDAPKQSWDVPEGQKPNALDNAYVSRSVPGINEAQQIKVTIEVVR